MTAQGPLDLNRAPAALLEELPGIGPVLARRIVAGRPYENHTELLAVSGIGPTLLAKLEGLVVVR
ncbi:MAG: helix-hairpin-helix domain-containing protein [Candidatus Coatesbacteria bacterium]|nr:helix-hairpin-helix domain-containing protein [Candidatus Coatesbacteria bacterium]